MSRENPIEENKITIKEEIPSSEQIEKTNSSEIVEDNIQKNNEAQEATVNTGKKIDTLKEEIGTTLMDKNLEQTIVSPELRAKMDSFEKDYNSGRVNSLVYQTHLNEATFYEFDEEKQKHVFLKKGLFGYKEILKKEDAEKLSSLINDAVEILPMSKTDLGNLISTQPDRNNRRISVTANLLNFLGDTINHVREVKK